MRTLLLLLPIFTACQSAQQYGDGQQLYTRHCANCHSDDGTGLEGLIPPLKAADMLQQGGAEVACWIRKGLNGKIFVNGREYEGEMPANKDLTEIEITNILNYINNSWGNQREFIAVDAVEKALNDCP